MNKKHHTKEKGDIGNLKIIANLAEQGLKVLVPLSEHLPFDLVAFNQDSDKLYRIQSKYKKVTNGKIAVSLRTSYATKEGNFSNRYKDNAFDVLAVYCPDIDSVFYISSEDVSHLDNSVTFKIEEPRAGASGVLTTTSRMVKDHLDFPV